MATFFEQQHIARKNTGRLVFLFATAILGIIFLVYLLIIGAIIFSSTPDGMRPQFADVIQPGLFLLVSFIVGSIIMVQSLWKIYSLRAGGKVIAESLGGRLLSPSQSSPAYRQLLDVVEEMAIASGTPVPPVYILANEKGINAFAAGYKPEDAVIGITAGAVEQLDRDELQAVIAHEFSHILNGDMRLNIKLIGYLAGILSVTTMGRILLRGGRGRSRGNQATLIAGIGMILIGLIGSLVGKIIQAAVSREREYLADASSVQFTRNPAGIYSALSKIGGVTAGSHIDATEAESCSHMFFADSTPTLLQNNFSVSGLTRKITGNLFATHPPIPLRLAAVERNAPGTLRAQLAEKRKQEQQKQRLATTKHDADTSPAGGRPGKSLRDVLPLESPTGQSAQHAMPAGAIISGQALMHSIGRVNEEHLALAREIIGEIPTQVREMAHEPYGARAVIYCLLLDNNDQQTQQQQMAVLQQFADPQVFELVGTILKPVATLPYRCRLPLIDMTIPALKELGEGQYQTFKTNVLHLIEADNHLSLSEWVALNVLSRNLDPHFAGRITQGELLRLENQHAQRAAQRALSMLAAFSSDESKIGEAFANGAKAAGLREGVMEKEVSVRQFDQDIKLLEQLNPLEKEKFLLACAAVIGTDGQINEIEAEIFRALGDALNSPVPLLLTDSYSHDHEPGMS